ncbi:MAG: isoprenylcysteine carboxylmethyltransferase family protein [Acidobacteria bacterium]|nr:MAG: isoprenylcysteine carboxylmethyltransferase family protein [Acidobacteriota bacterium]
MLRLLALLYGVFCYLVFLVSFFWAIWFVWTLDAPRSGLSLGLALLIDAGLLALFAIQHSGMARQKFKRAWTKLLPRPLERSTYVLFSSLALLAIIVFWQPMPSVIWDIGPGFGRIVLQVLFWAGWLNLLLATFIIDHFDLFGLRQTWMYFRGVPYKYPGFRTPMEYKYVRHPIYLSFLIAFWSTPRMTLGHLFFAVMCTGFMLVAIQFEERDLVCFHGERYLEYKNQVPMLIPRPMKKAAVRESSPATDD